MTYGDVMAKVVTQLTHMSAEEVGFIMEQFKVTHPDASRFDENLSEEEAAVIEKNLIAQAPAILHWLAGVVKEEHQQFGNA